MKRYSKDLPSKEALNELSTEHRHVVCAYHVYRDYQLATKDLRIKIGTFKSRLSRARKLIAKYEQERSLENAY